MNDIRFQFYPKNKKLPKHLETLILEGFKKNHDKISSDENTLHSNEVLSTIRSSLLKLGYKVESGKSDKQKIPMPVLFGENGKIEKRFFPDAFSEEYKTVIEVEAGQAVENNRFLKDFFECCIMVDIEYCVIAARSKYSFGQKTKMTKDHYAIILKFFDTMYASGRLGIPLKGLLIIGY